MSKPKASFTEAQLREIEEQISSATRGVATTIQSETVRVLDRRHTTMLADLKQAVTGAVNEKYRVVVAELGHSEEGKKSKAWDVFVIALPVLLTAGLGLFIDRKLDDQKQALSTRMALTQEFYKRKFDVYQKAYLQMTGTADALQTVGLDRSLNRENAADNKDATDRLTDFKQSSLTSALYMSPEVSNDLGDVGDKCVDFMRSKATLSQVQESIKNAEIRMRQELRGSVTPMDEGGEHSPK